MYIESVQLQNFRNYRELQLDFDKGTNIFYGDNAQGKTNILESVYICGTTKSHKGSKDKELIRFGEEESHIRMMIKKDGLSYKIDMHLRKNKAKGVAINGLPIKKARELFGNYKKHLPTKKEFQEKLGEYQRRIAGKIEEKGLSEYAEGIRSRSKGFREQYQERVSRITGVNKRFMKAYPTIHKVSRKKKGNQKETK